MPVHSALFSSQNLSVYTNLIEASEKVRDRKKTRRQMRAQMDL